jgi:hypothetical protein
MDPSLCAGNGARVDGVDEEKSNVRAVIARLALPLKIGVVVAASSALVAAHGFSSTTNASADSFPSRSDVTVSLGSGHGAVGTLSGVAADLAPGDTYENTFSVTIAAAAQSHARAKVTLQIVTLPEASSALDSDAADGLRIALDLCSSASGWRVRSGAPMCTGRTTSLVAPQPVARLKGRVLAMPAMEAGVPAQIRVWFQLPMTAGNSFERLSSSLRLTFATTA